ncbi:hypothetical protein BGZ73_003246 [Actinomortierella ambigua]|nr:hypothetical protein BGZ73_003246 [Actinomortierella ambigua]
MPLAQITSLSSLIKHIDALALPDQLSSILSNRLLQHAFCLQPSSSLISRISYWLGQELVDLWFWGEKTAATRERFGEILRKMVDVTVLIKDLFPVVETFLMPFLRMWNGRDHQKEIFTLLSYLRPRSFEELYAFFLKPLQKIFYSSGPKWKASLLLCYRRLLQRWALINWRGHLSPERGYLISPADHKSMQGLFTKLSENVDYMKTMQEFIMHVDRVATVAFEVDESNISVQHGVLSFLDLASTLPITFRVPMAVIIPDSTIVYRCFLADSGMAMSRICGIILQFKNAFESFENEQQNYQARLLEYELQQQQAQRDRESAIDQNIPLIPPPSPPPLSDVPGYSRDYVTFFNSFVMDICNFLWRSRAFNKTDKNARGFQVDAKTISRARQICTEGGLNMNNMFSLTHSLAMAGYSSQFVKSLEQKAGIPKEKQLNGPASLQSLKDRAEKGGLQIPFAEYRVQYLEHLETKGFDGACHFVQECITSLVQRRLQLAEEKKALEEMDPAADGTAPLVE